MLENFNNTDMGRELLDKVLRRKSDQEPGVAQKRIVATSQKQAPADRPGDAVG